MKNNIVNKDIIVKKNILGVDVSDTSSKNALKYIFTILLKQESSSYIVTPNPEMIMLAKRDSEFVTILNNASLSLCDGVGLLIASRLLQQPLKERITGVDLIESISNESRNKLVSIGFIGGKKGVAVRAAERLKMKYPWIVVKLTEVEWEGSATQDSLKTKQHGRAPLVDILFVAFGFPKQERFMAEHKNSGLFKVAVGVGGAFDYLSGDIPRAPRVVRSVGLEWLYRLLHQPWRWKRQLALLAFINLVVKSVLSRSK